jgi:hypothetical protein
LQKPEERQEHRIRKDCQKQAAGAERQFLKTESVCQKLAKKADKSKIRRKATETKFWNPLSRLTYPFFLYNGDKEFRITGANAPKKFQLLDRRRWIKIIGKQSISNSLFCLTFFLYSDILASCSSGHSSRVLLPISF